ncbi:MAG: hypothetical protein IEMM0008_0045 [bacterium]|nr:MAG: hypothetical protein IEMM0008_0045 [bacterium]
MKKIILMLLMVFAIGIFAECGDGKVKDESKNPCNAKKMHKAMKKMHKKKKKRRKRRKKRRKKRKKRRKAKKHAM